MAEMTALFGGCGPKWQARQVEVPEPGPAQVLIRTHAVSVNNADIAMLTDDNTADHQNATCAGYEFAGEVAALAEVDSFRVGDAVMGTAPHSFAEYVVADHRHLFPIPEGVSDEDAAALPTGLLTEHGALQLARFEPGQTVLITAASSNIGLIGLQIAKALGAGTVIATSRTADKTDLLAQTGADVVVATDTQDLATAVFDATSHNGVDIVLDHVGGQTLSDCLPTTTVDGHLVSIGRLSQDETTISLSALAGRQLDLHGVSYGFTPPERTGRAVAAARELLPAVADGHVRPVIDSVYKFEDHEQAAVRVRNGTGTGKIVLTLRR